MKLSKKHKAAIKSYLRAVAASGLTVVLAIVADIRPEYAILLGSLVAPLAKAIDPTSVLSMIMALMRNDTERMGWFSRWRMRYRKQYIVGSTLGY